MRQGAADKAAIQLVQVQAVSIAQVGHVAMPHPGMGNHPGDAWCKRPGRPARRCCGGCNLGPSERRSLKINE